MTESEPNELFAERPVRSDFASPELPRFAGPPYVVRRIITVAVLVVLAIGGLYWAFSSTHEVSAPGTVPLIKAEAPYKHRPDQPGGIDIPHQDVQAYQALDTNGKSAPPPQAEHLLPPPEVPQAAPATPAPVSAPAATPALPAAPQLESLALQPPPPAPVAAAVTPPPPAPLAVTPAPAAPAAVSPAPKAAAVAKKTVVKAVPSAPAVQVFPLTSGGGKMTVVQLASLPDPAAAQIQAGKLQTKYAAILKDARLHVVKADLGAKGIYYRIQSLPVAEGEAHDICTSLKSINAGCFIVRP